jgi:hypothetical protein
MADLPMAEGRPTVPAEKGFGATQRRDAWWTEWLSVAIGLLILGVYAFWAACQNKDYSWGSYLSPFYSPAFLQIKHHWFPMAIIPLTVIVAFRGTCYYYRKAYYRAFFADPPGCAVGEPRNRYSGETAFPWLVQNSHRFFMYLACVALFFLWVDVIKSFFWSGPMHSIVQPELHLGSLIMLANVILLSGYTLGCHSIRHLVGGRLDCFSCAKACASAWKGVSKLNARHQQWAWLSLFSVCFTDLYIRLVAMGIWHDWRIL